jgi:two-component system, NarL family, response regulator NreC
MSQSAKITVLLADDHTLVRKGLAALLEIEPDMTVVAEAENGHEAIAHARELAPDVILMDISLPLINGIEATRHITSTPHHSRVLILSMHKLILSMHNKKEYIMQSLAAGASGYLLKNTGPRVLIEAIRKVKQGHGFLSPEISHTVIQALTEQNERLKTATVPADPLSKREREILQLIAEGRSSKEVAALLFISVKTVENHRKSIMAKLDIHNMALLVQYAIRHGILPLDDLY